MSDVELPTNRGARAGERRVLRTAMIVLCAAGVLIAYALGRWGALDAERQAKAVQDENTLLHAHRYLGLAAFEAARANFANASAAATRFYDALDERLSRDEGLSQTSRERLQALRAQRDGVTAEIARANPAVARTLQNAYMEMNGVVQEQRRVVTGATPPQP